MTWWVPGVQSRSIHHYREAQIPFWGLRLSLSFTMDILPSIFSFQIRHGVEEEKKGNFLLDSHCDSLADSWALSQPPMLTTLNIPAYHRKLVV